MSNLKEDDDCKKWSLKIKNVYVYSTFLHEKKWQTNNAPPPLR